MIMPIPPKSEAPCVAPIVRSPPESDAQLIGDCVRDRQVELCAATMTLLRRYQGSQHMIFSCRPTQPDLGRAHFYLIYVAQERSSRGLGIRPSGAELPRPTHAGAIGGTEALIRQPYSWQIGRSSVGALVHARTCDCARHRAHRWWPALASTMDRRPLSPL